MRGWCHRRCRRSLRVVARVDVANADPRRLRALQRAPEGVLAVPLEAMDLFGVAGSASAPRHCQRRPATSTRSSTAISPDGELAPVSGMSIVCGPRCGRARGQSGSAARRRCRSRATSSPSVWFSHSITEPLSWQGSVMCSFNQAPAAGSAAPSDPQPEVQVREVPRRARATAPGRARRGRRPRAAPPRRCRAWPASVPTPPARLPLTSSAAIPPVSERTLMTRPSLSGIHCWVERS